MNEGMNEGSSLQIVLVWFTRAHHSFSGSKPTEKSLLGHRLLTWKKSHLGVLLPSLGCVVPVAGTDVRTGDYKHLRGLLRSVCQVSSPLVNATLGGPLAVLTHDSSVGLSVKAAA